jgi:hypothetical protein
LPSASGTSVRGTLRVHRSPPHVDDVGQRPSVGMGWQQMWTDLQLLKIRIFFRKALDRPNQLERAQEIGFCTRRFSTKVLWRKADQLTSLARPPNQLREGRAMWAIQRLDRPCRRLAVCQGEREYGFQNGCGMQSITPKRKQSTECEPVHRTGCLKKATIKTRATRVAGGHNRYLL